MNIIIYGIGLFVAFHIAVFAIAKVRWLYLRWRYEWAREMDRDYREQALREKRPKNTSFDW
ncbi:MAG: hypothetical protein J0H60_23780 [Rhizobiales bacterium]|mgnify:CR=1 FL=1|nr:hypothetical protein [Hyphomicrobiales bacterium]